MYWCDDYISKNPENGLEHLSDSVFDSCFLSLSVKITVTIMEMSSFISAVLTLLKFMKSLSVISIYLYVRVSMFMFMFMCVLL